MLDKFKEAISCYKEAVSIDPKFIHAYHNLGSTYTAMGNFVEAKNFVTHILEILGSFLITATCPWRPTV